MTSIRSTGPKVGNYGFRPQLLPDGRILLIVESDDGEPRPGILNVDTGEMLVFDMIAVSASYLASGHLLCLRTNGALMAVPFDAKNTRVTGAEVSDPEVLLRGPQEKGTGAFTPGGQSYVFPQYEAGKNTTGAHLFRVRLGTNGRPSESRTRRLRK